MTCFFIGHRDAGWELMPKLEAEVKRHISELGVTEFIVGQYGAFDRMAARAVLNAKTEYPAIRLTILLPYHPGERNIRAPKGYDGTLYPPGMEQVPHRYAIIRANMYMVEHSDYLIAYVWHPASNARDLLYYAKTREKRGLIQITCMDKD